MRARATQLTACIQRQNDSECWKTTAESIVPAYTERPMKSVEFGDFNSVFVCETLYFVDVKLLIQACDFSAYSFISRKFTSHLYFADFHKSIILELINAQKKKNKNNTQKNYFETFFVSQKQDVYWSQMKVEKVANWANRLRQSRNFFFSIRTKS